MQIAGVLFRREEKWLGEEGLVYRRKAEENQCTGRRETWRREKNNKDVGK